MTVDELVQTLVALVAQGEATLDVLAQHTGMYEEVPVTEVELVEQDNGYRYVVLR